MKNLLTILSACLITMNSMGQGFQKTFGGAGGDIGNSVQQTADGGFIILGNASSFGPGLNDVYLIRTDANGDTLWTKSFGESGEDFGNSVQQTADGGFIIAGYTNSFGAIGYDVYLIKTDSTGVIIWSKIYGGTGADLGNSVQQTFDGGYIITGYTNSFGVSGVDVYLVRTDANGGTLWTKTFGGAINDYGNSVRQTADSGYIIAGYSNSFGAGNRDVYLIRTDADGDTLWTRTFGGPGFDRGNSVQQTADGGYIVTGFTGLGAGSNDVYLIRTDANGDTVWTKAYGGTGAEEGYSVFQTADGGYVITGFTNSFGAGSDDVYLVRTSANGALLWSKTFGGTAAGDYGNSVQQTADGGYIIAGYTGFGTGGNDVYLIRTDVNGNSGGCHQSSPNTILTNPATQVNSSGPTIGAGATINNAVTIVNNTATIVYDLNISLSIAGTDVSCTGGSDGSADLTVSGGIPFYSFLWTNGETTEDINGIQAGTYGVTVVDANGCMAIDMVNISELPGMSLSFITVDATCIAACNGSAVVIPAGGTAPFTYQWNDSLLQTNDTAINLCAGNYSVTVTDSNGCIATNSVSIPALPGISLSFTNVKASCAACDGFATVTPTGGTAPYTYLWSDGQTTATAFNLCIGNYTVTVTDSIGCINSGTTIVYQISNSIVINYSNSSASCGQCNGFIEALPIGGTSPYTYLWNDGQTTATASGLCAGTYSVTATDANGCIKTSTISVGGTPGIDPLSFFTSNSSCGSCDGLAHVFVNGGTSPFSYLWSDGKTSATVSNICPGIYTVNVTDANGCNATDDVIVSGSSGISLSFSNSDASCGACVGAAIVTPSAGTPPYTYLWSDGQTTDTASGLCSGNYTVSVEDTSACPEIGSVTISEPFPISLSFSFGNASTCGSCDGWVQVTASGGTGHTYLWSNGQTGSIATGLCFGINIIVTVTNAEGCSVSDSITISVVSGISINNTNGNFPYCGECNGTLEIVAMSGGTPPYTYVWSDGQTDSLATGLCSGNYSVIVTDVNGCIGTNNYLLPGSLGITSLTFSSTDALCGACDGSATVSPISDDQPITYLWSDGQTTATASDLCAGIYDFTVTDAVGCSMSGITVINNTGGSTITLDSISNVSCNGGSDGAIYITASGGIPPYSYSWLICYSICDTICYAICDTIVIEDVSNLVAGTYIVTVTDGGGCVSIESFSITEPVMILSMTIDSMILCNGDTGGVLTVNLSGGIPPYNYIWSTGDSTIGSSLQTDEITGLSAGIYSVTVTDSIGCASIDTLTLTEPDSLILTVTVDNNVGCPGDSDGVVTANIAGGISPYDYSWSTGESTIGTTLLTNTISDLSTGIYIVTISDINGCTTIDSVTITEPDTIILTATVDSNVSCNGGSDGMATINLTGGIPPYDYVWSNGSFTIGSADTTNTETGLSAGTYSVTITDANGCSAVDSVTISEPSALSLTIDKSFANCGLNDGMAWVVVNGGTNPYTYVWNDVFSQTTDTAFNLYSGIYTVSVTDANGCIEAETTVVNNLGGPIIAVDTTSNTTCNGGSDGVVNITISGGTSPYIYLWSNSDTVEDISNLAAGTYIVNVTDVNNCQVFDFININEPPAIILATTTDDNVSCNGGSDAAATVTIISGGIAPYDYTWSSGGSALGSADTTNSEIGLPAGTYTVSVTDANGCTAAGSVTITEPSAIVLTTGSLPDTLSDSSTAWVIVSGGIPPYSYQWNDLFLQTNDTAFNLLAGNYMVIVTDNNGCIDNSSVTVSNILGIFDYSNADYVHIYPNPNTGLFTVKLVLTPSARGIEFHIKLYHISGKLIYTKKISNAGKYSQQIDLSGYSKGIYYLQIVSDRGVITKKVIYQ